LNAVQLANASDKLLEIEARKAKARQLNRDGGGKFTTTVEEDKGKARDLVAKNPFSENGLKFKPLKHAIGVKI